MRLICPLVSQDQPSCPAEQSRSIPDFSGGQHETQSEILRLRFAPLGITKTTGSIDLLATIGDFRNQGFVNLLESAAAIGGIKDVAG